MSNEPTNPDDAGGVADGPGEGEDAGREDPDLVGPDGTEYEEDAAEEAERKMTGGTDA